MLPTLNKFVRAGAAGALAAAALAGPVTGTAHAAEKVTPDVTGLQRVLVVGCRFHDTTSPDILDYSNGGIRQILSHTHDYFDTQSNHRVDFEGEFTGWHTLPKTSTTTAATATTPPRTARTSRSRSSPTAASRRPTTATS